MEKKQYELCIEVLRRLNKADVLNNIILIGSWCLPFYKDYFTGLKYASSVKTRDIDFLIPVPSSIKSRVDLANLFKDLGFVVGFKGSRGYMRLEHPDLIIELLVPEKGRGIDRPYPLPQLGLNAQALRFLGLITLKTISVKIENIEVTLPHPACFALHKLIISARRRDRDKKLKDKETALQLLKTLIDKGDSVVIIEIFNLMLQSWQKKVIKELTGLNEKEILEVLRQ